MLTHRLAEFGLVAAAFEQADGRIHAFEQADGILRTFEQVDGILHAFEQAGGRIHPGGARETVAAPTYLGLPASRAASTTAAWTTAAC